MCFPYRTVLYIPHAVIPLFKNSRPQVEEIPLDVSNASARSFHTANKALNAKL